MRVQLFDGELSTHEQQIYVQQLDCLAYDYSPSTGVCVLHWDKATAQSQYTANVNFNAYDRIL
jgi:hypothetical protein